MEAAPKYMLGVIGGTGLADALFGGDGGDDEQQAELVARQIYAQSRRALARALTGSRAGAQADLAVYLAWAGQNGEAQDRIERRRQWAEQLAAGIDPFDAAALQALRDE